MDIRNGRFLLGDCFEQMATLPDKSVDMVLCDLPYGTTQNKWDSVLPLDALWAEIWRLVNDAGATVLTAAQPFTSGLGSSQINNLRYSLIWDKVRPVGHLNARRRPMQRHEDVLVFCRNTPPYYPQGVLPSEKINRRSKIGDNYNDSGTRNKATGTGYPQSILRFPPERGFHPTQKPVALFEYLIRTYTEPDAVVLDMTAGSGTTAIAAERAGRRWVCIERDESYYWQAVARIFEGKEI